MFKAKNNIKAFQERIYATLITIAKTVTIIPSHVRTVYLKLQKHYIACIRHRFCTKDLFDEDLYLPQFLAKYATYIWLDHHASITAKMFMWKNIYLYL